ncbi:uncharacterized protein [Watersipora subatra]|uniref:uncharacterized protein n=1 Tax=Watersipora subatra TaxID=2589382 RepID=UPI00355BED56
MLLDRTRDEQLKEIASMYSALKSEVVRRRNSTEGEIKEFQKEAVAEELSRLNTILQTIQLRLSARQLVDLVRNSRETEAEIESTVGRKLPSLKVPAGVRLDIKKQSVINAVIEESKGSILVQINSAAQPELSKLSAEASIKAKHTTASVSLSEDEEEIPQQSETWKQRTYEQTEVEDEFDKIYYEFLKIIRVREFKAKVLGKYDGEIVESEKISDPKFLMVKTKSSVPGEARKMMDALLDLFYDVTRSAHSHTIKLEYDGDKEKLSKALIDDLQDPSLGFIARLVTNEDIRIIGSLANMDRDIHTLESYIYDYKKTNPAQTVTEKRQADIKLSNGTLVSIVEGDLTKMKFDAVVSSSSMDLSHQYGVSRAIALACGQRFQTQGNEFVDRRGIFREGETWGQLADGDLARNGVSYVIHAIAPSPEKGRDVSPLLVKTISNTLNEVEKLKCKTVAFPAICAGIMGVPISTCAECYWTALEKFSSLHPRARLQHIRFVVNDAGFVIDLYNAMYNLFMERKANVFSRPQPLEISGAAAYPGAAARVTINSSSATANHRYSPTSPLDKTYGDYGYSNTTGSANDSSYELSPVHQVRSDRHRSTSISAKRSSVAGATGGSQYKATTRASSSVTKSMLSRNECPICLDELKDYETLPCTHRFCKGCIKQLIETTKTNQCPTCRKPFRTAEGKQPKGGRMSTTRSPLSLPGYEKHGSIVITYDIPGGVQGPEHPHPGKRYQGTNRKAFLPDNVKGRKAAKLLKKAFDQRLVFTVGQSVTTGQDDCVVWNDIHHKTSMRGGPSNYGYPDSDYLTRLIDDLKARGIAD